MLKIIVFPNKEKGITADNRIIEIYPLFTEDGERLHYRTDFSGVEDIEIRVLRWYLPLFAFRLSLTREIRRGVIEFLHRYHARQDMSFDCYSFACLVHEASREYGSRFWTYFWEEMPRRRWWRKPGDVVFLINREKKLFHHAAIYVGFGLYISVYGAGGDLEIATLNDMKRDYRAADAIFVTPQE